MELFQTIRMWISMNFPWLKVPSISIDIIDIIEIVILSFLVYSVLVWIKDSRAWTLLKGLLMLGFFVALAYLFRMDTITYLIRQGLTLVITASIIIFQPELRRALESLGEKAIFSELLPSGQNKDVQQRFTDRTVNEIVRATMEMAKVKTGALMVLEANENLNEYIRTGIDIDAVVSSQLLINIFEHNTPLHDGAVIIRGDKIVSATCYLPLSETKSLGKELGTRHRAGVGVSEVTDSMTIIVSEETGRISIARKGALMHSVSEETLREQLVRHQNKKIVQKKNLITGILLSDRKAKTEQDKNKEA